MALIIPTISKLVDRNGVELYLGAKVKCELTGSFSFSKGAIGTIVFNISNYRFGITTSDDYSSDFINNRTSLPMWLTPGNAKKLILC